MSTIAEMLTASGAAVKIIEGSKKAQKTVAAAVDLSQFVFKAPRVPNTKGIPMTPEGQAVVQAEFTRFKTELQENLEISAKQVWQYLRMDSSMQLPFRAGYDAITRAVGEALNYEDFASREVARLVWVTALVATAPTEQWAVYEIIERACALGVLETAKPVEKFAARVGRDHYKIGAGFLKNSDSRILFANFKSLAQTVYTATRQELASESSALVASIGKQITVSDLRAGNPGQIVLKVPAYEIMNREGGSVWQASGTILAEVGADRKIRIRKAAGPLARFSGDLLSGEVFIYPEQIPTEKPSPSDRVHLNTQLPPEVYGQLMRLWRWVSEGAILAEAEAAKVAEGEAQAAEFEKWKEETIAGVPAGETLLSREEWLLRHQDGLVFVNRAEFARPGDDLTFRWFIPKSDQSDSVQVDKSELNPMAVLLRKEGKISLVSCPTHQRENFWKGVIEPQPEGEKFADLPWQVGKLLQIFFGATVAAQNAAKRQQAVAADAADTASMAAAMLAHRQDEE